MSKKSPKLTLNKYSKRLHQHIITLKNDNIEIFNKFMIDVYLSGCLIEDYIKLHQTIENHDSVITPENIQTFKHQLKTNGIFDKMKCVECNKILDRSKFNKTKPGRCFSYCKDCEIIKRVQKNKNNSKIQKHDSTKFDLNKYTKRLHKHVIKLRKKILMNLNNL